MAYTRAFDETRPQGNIVDANTLDSEIQYVRTDFRERLADIFGLTALEFAADPIVIKQVALNRHTTSKILGGTVSLSLRNSADNADNLILTDAGVATFRANVNAPTFTGALSGNATTATTATTANAVAAANITGTTLAANVVTSSLTSVGVLTSLVVSGNVAAGSFNGTLTGAVIGNVTGNSTTSTTLQTARFINGVSFNGSADITVTAAAGTLTGATLNATVTSSNLSTVGTLNSLNVVGTVIAGGFNGPLTGTVTGNASTATVLFTTRAINGVGFNGSADITIPAAAGTLSGVTLAAGVINSSLTSVGNLGVLTVTGLAGVGSLTVGAGQTLGKLLYATRVYDMPSVLVGGIDDFTITVAGAAIGDPVFINTPFWNNGTWSYVAYVSAPNTVSVRSVNISGSTVDQASGTYTAVVLHF